MCVCVCYHAAITVCWGEVQNLPTLKFLLSVLQRACVRIFSFLTGFFCCCCSDAPPIKENKSVKEQYFSYSSWKNSIWTHIFNYTDLLQTGTFRRLHFVYICQSRFGSKTAEHFLQKQSTVSAAFTDANASLFERLLSGRSLFPWFLAFFLLFATFVQPLVTDRFEFKPAISEDG